MAFIVIFATVQLVNILRKSAFKGILGMLLITVFTIKSCDLFIDYCCTYNKYISVDDPTDDENRDVSEDCFEKSAKKLFSCFENPTSFRSVTWITPLTVHWTVYSFSIFKEPLRVVLTPPPNALLA